MTRSAPLAFVAALLAAVPACASQQPLDLAPFSFVQVRGDVDVTVVPGQAQRVTILSGDPATSHLAVDGDKRLVVDACAARCPASYHLRLQIESPEMLPIAVERGARVTAAGGFPAQKKLFLAANGGGQVDTRSVQADDVFAAASGGGQLLVRASSNLFGVADGGSSIRYWGDPRLMTKGASGTIEQAGR